MLNLKTFGYFLTKCPGAGISVTHMCGMLGMHPNMVKCNPFFKNRQFWCSSGKYWNMWEQHIHAMLFKEKANISVS